MEINSVVKVLKVTDAKQLMLEGSNATITAKVGSVFFAETESGMKFQFDAEGRMGITVVPYTRKDEAAIHKAELVKATKAFEDFKADVLEEINRLENYESDEAYDKAQFKQAVLEAVKPD